MARAKHSDKDATTARARVEESKREATKSYVTILEQEITEGLEALERPPRGLFLSGLSAGLDIGFSVLAIAIVTTLAEDELSKSAFTLLRANAYAVGFILVIFGRSELFTEHTTLAFLPVLDGRASGRQLAQLWGVIFIANLIGGTVFAGFLTIIGPALGIIEAEVLGRMAESVVAHKWWVILASGVLAGWMMGLVSWLVTAGRDTMSQIFFVWLVTAVIGLAQLHHCIVGSIEVLCGIFSGSTSVGAFAHFMVFATAGNIIGGVVFVAVIKYAHAKAIRGGMRSESTWRIS